MSAEADLQEWLQDYGRLSGDAASRHAKRFMDQHAHELAEKIRATDLGGSCAASASCDWLVNAAASLIDPEGNSND